MAAFEILPMEGLGPVRFGQRPAEVEALMAEEHAYEDWMGGNLNDSLLYKGLILGFDRCNSDGPLRRSRLVDARMRGRDGAILFGRPLGEWARAELVAFLRSRGNIVDDSTPDVTVASLGLSASFNGVGQIDYFDLWEPADLRESVWVRLKRLLRIDG